MRTYITGTSSISPQLTFDHERYLQEIMVPEQEYFKALEPDYKQYIDPKQSRRMARIIKMSMVAAQNCLEKAGIEHPGAIIVGTGLGCLQDTEKFLTDIVENDEGLLSPTSFIQSTHNTIAGQIALVLSCPNHNFTYVQRGHSFESALQDGMMQLEEGATDVLIGGVDEITPTLYAILKKLNCIDLPAERYPTLKFSPQRPALGEGASFFTLSRNRSSNAVACIESSHVFYHPDSEADVAEQINSFLQKCGLQVNDLGAVMMGFNGHQEEDQLYFDLHQKLFHDKIILSFKNLCGEYFTASAFGHHLAANVLHQQKIFDHTLVAGNPGPVNNLLFYNHYKGKYHTLTLLSRCQPL